MRSVSSLASAVRRTLVAVCFLPHKMAIVVQWLVSLLYDYFKTMRLFLPPRNKGYMYARVAEEEGMQRRWAKLSLLLWKNWVLAKRHPKQMAVEVLAPVFLFSLLMVIRSLVVPVVYSEPTVFRPFSPASLNGTIVPVIANATEYGGVLGYSPTGPALDRIMNSTAQKLGLRAIPATSEEVLLDFISSHYGAMKVTLAAVVFNESLSKAEKLPNNIKVKIRLPGESRVPVKTMSVSGVLNWNTNLLFPLFEAAGPRDKNITEGSFSPGYYQEGFLALQHALSTSITEQVSPGRSLPAIQLQRFPYPPYIDDPLLPALQAFASIIIMVSFSYTCIYIVKAITLEKEQQLKETMKIMGLSNWLHWAAWFAQNFVMLAISAALMVSLVKVPCLMGSTLSVFTFTDGSLLFVFMLLYASTTIAFCFMMSVFFSTANIAATVAGLGWFLSFSPYLLKNAEYDDMSLASKTVSCLFSNTAMAYGVQIIMMHEGAGYGLHWSSVWKPARPDDNFLFGHVMIMMVVDTVIYLLVAIYIEAIYPGAYGVPKPWYFPLLPSYWCGDRRVAKKMDEEDLELESDVEPNSDMFEPEPSHVHAGIRIRNLHKVYGKRTVVKNLTLNMYEGQVTVLLGHNGAGKTSTMSMLTGLITPTSGTAIVGGCDVRAHIEGARASLGLCPQQNILFPEMTVREHVYFFCKLKGMAEDDIEEEINKYLQLLNLESKADAKSVALSGGQKRKLCVAIALCADSKVVVLDEPSSGMDPAARRALWDLLRAEKRDRTILLTTHFMDEADVLGDRIAIMAAGQLLCCGSSFFLKKKYGTGYQLVVVKGPECKASDVTKLLQKYIPVPQVIQNGTSELSYVLDEQKSFTFQPMLRELEERQSELCVKSYGVSLTTMEEVFMKVGKEQDVVSNGKHCHENDTRDFKVNLSDNNPDERNISDSQTLLEKSLCGELLTGVWLVLNQLRAMLQKNMLYMWYTVVLFLVQLLIPVVNMSITFLVVKQWQSSKDLPPISLTTQLYASPVTPVGLLSNNSDVVALYELYKDLYPTGLLDLNQEVQSGAAPNITSFMLHETEKHLKLVRQHYIVGSTFAGEREEGGGPVLTGLFNNQPLHSPPIALNMLHNVVLRWVSGRNYSLSIVNHPLPYLQETKVNFVFTANNLGFQLAFNVTFAMCFVMAFYVLLRIKERASKSKHLQFVSGVKVLVYWGVSYLLDMASFILVTLAVLGTMLVSQEDGYHTPDQLGRYFLLFASFGCGMLPLMYLASYFYLSPTTGFTRVVMWNAFTGVAGYLVVSILQLPELDLESLASTLDKLLTVVPLYSLGISLRNMYNNYIVLDACKLLSTKCHIVHNPCCRVAEQCPNGRCIPLVQNYFDWNYPGVGRNIWIFFIDGFIFIAILLLVEFRVFDSIMYSINMLGTRNSRSCDEEPEDSDVLEEKEKIHSTEIQILHKEYKLLLVDVSKYYGNFPAVKQLCIGVKSGECFGLLGVNGAGKTSTFKMLTGDYHISSGEAYVNGLNIKSHMNQVFQMIGYCPQFDALIEELTGRETLTMFCLLRGVPATKIPDVVGHLAQKLLFVTHIDKKVSKYSGGNKRKLSTAIALIGDPAVVYLDEPTSGMDTMAKRHLWDVIRDVRNRGKSIVLTSHSMEECEALCTRIAIMVNGQLKCLGSPQYLKSKFAEGYTLTVKISAQRDPCGGTFRVDSVKEFVKSSFPGAVLREEHEGLITFYIPTPALTWSSMFGKMEYAKTRLDIEDYSLAQTSLEQVFLSFTKYQRLNK